MPSAKKASPSARDASPRATPSPRGPASPRGHGSPQKASPPPSRASNRRTAFDEGHRTASLAAAQRAARQRAKVYQTETEQAFTEPSTRQVRQPRPPPRPKAADTNFLSENLLVPDPTKMPWERASMMDLYPEKYKGSAGITSTEKEKQLARSTMVEYFPEKHAQNRIASEFEEVVYGRGADGVQEVALLNPNAFMGGAGLTSKEYALRVRRSQIEERLQNPAKAVEPAPYLATAADELVYGRGLVRDKRGSRKSIIDLPTKGSGHATYESAAGLSSIDVQQMTAEPLELALDQKIDERSRPHLGSTVDKLIYHSSTASGANSPTDIKSLKPKLFENAAGITSQESASPDLKAFRTNKKTGHRLHQARSGGEGEELMYGRTSALEFEVQKLAPKSFEGAAGMKSKDVFLRNKTEQMYLRHIPVSASSLTNEAKYTIYFDKLPEDKPMFDISHLYPKEYRHAAGGSSRALFENGPEAERRHMFSENLKKHTVGKKGHGYDARASSRVKEGAAGLRSEQLFDGHELHGIGDERPSISVEASQKKIPHNMRGEAASVLLYGSEDPNAEENFELIPCIPDRNPKAFEDAAGLESGVIMRVQDTLCARHDPGAHKLSLARWGGESEELIYGKGPTNVSVEYEVQKLAPKAYEGAYGTPSKKISATMLRNVDPEMSKGGRRRAQEGLGASPTEGSPKSNAPADRSTAGLSSKELNLHALGEFVHQRPPKLDLRIGGEAASLINFETSPQAIENCVTDMDPSTPGKQPLYEGAAGAPSKFISRPTLDARKRNVPTLEDPGGSETRAIIYGYEGVGDGSVNSMYDADDSPSFDIPELLPEKFIGAAGMTSKDWCRQRNGHWMFGEKVEGAAHGAKRPTRHNDLSMPTEAYVGRDRSAANWGHDDDERRQRNFEADSSSPAAAPDCVRGRETAEYREWANRVHQQHLYEEYRREAEEFGDAEYYFPRHDETDEAHGMSIEHSQDLQAHWTEPQQYDPSDFPSHCFPAEYAQQAQQFREQVHAATAGAKAEQDINEGRRYRADAHNSMPDSPDQAQTQTPGHASSTDVTQELRQQQQHSPSQLGWKSKSEVRGQSPPRNAPRLFERGSFAHQKLQSIRAAESEGNGNSVLTGRSSGRSGAAAMGAYTDFAARVQAADSRRESARAARSQRSAR